MAFHKLKHFQRTHTLGEEGYKSFALIRLPDEMDDSCVTLVRCKTEKVSHEMLYWGTFNTHDLECIENLDRGEQIYLSEEDLIIRLS